MKKDTKSPKKAAVKAPVKKSNSAAPKAVKAPAAKSAAKAAPVKKSTPAKPVPAKKVAAPKKTCKCQNGKKDCKCEGEDCKCKNGKKSCDCSKKDCKCSEDKFCFEELIKEIFGQLSDESVLAALMQDYFYTELLKKGFDENMANTLANKVIVDISDFSANIEIKEDE